MKRIFALILMLGLWSCQSQEDKSTTSAPIKREHSGPRKWEQVPVKTSQDGLAFDLEWKGNRALAKFNLQEGEEVVYSFLAGPKEKIQIVVQPQDLEAGIVIKKLVHPSGLEDSINFRIHRIPATEAGTYKIHVGATPGKKGLGEFVLKVNKIPPRNHS